MNAQRPTNLYTVNGLRTFGRLHPEGAVDRPLHSHLMFFRSHMTLGDNMLLEFVDISFAFNPNASRLVLEAMPNGLRKLYTFNVFNVQPELQEMLPGVVYHLEFVSVIIEAAGGFFTALLRTLKWPRQRSCTTCARNSTPWKK